MEAVPRLKFLFFPLKTSPEGTSFSNLKIFIAEYYQEDPESFSKEVHTLESLRNSAMRPQNNTNGCRTLKRYYSQLHSILNRFPLVSENKLFTFSWKDLYTNNVLEINDLRYEMAAVLYNIAVLHTQIGANSSREDSDGMKLACTHFQCAAWAFGELREKFKECAGDFMTSELLMFMQQVSFAQAQECILEKSLIDNRKPGIVAKVAAQVMQYYCSALVVLCNGNKDGSPISQIIDSSVFAVWKKYIRFKIPYINCILYLYQGQHYEEEKKMGERLALYQKAWEKLEEARKESKGLPDQQEIIESLTFTADVVEGKRKNAKNENEFIYHETVPDVSEIPSVQAANLVNGISFSVTDPDVCGEDIFARLVPMKAHEASSLYSEEKAKILRVIGEKIDSKNNELNSFMSSLNVEHLNSKDDQQSNKVPQGIVDRCAALNAKPNAIPDLVSSMSNLAECCSDVEINLKEIKQILTEEEQKELQYQKEFGVHRSNTHLIELTREFQKYLEAHQKAGDSNDTLRRAMELHVNNLRILSRPLQDIQSRVPKLTGDTNLEQFNELKLLINKVNEMKAQREHLHAELRIAINDDDITSKLIANGDEELKELFKKEISKHDKCIKLIEHNITAQENILKALTDAYARCAQNIKILSDIKHKKETFFSSLAASHDVYEDLLAKSAKGLEFYKKLQTNIQKLLTRVRAAHDVQAEDREQRIKLVTTKTNNDVLLSNDVYPQTSNNTAPKLRDFLSKKSSSTSVGFNSTNYNSNDKSSIKMNQYIPSIRPNPLGSENPTVATCFTSSGNPLPQQSFKYNPATTSSPPPQYTPGTGYLNPIYQSPIVYPNTAAIQGPPPSYQQQQHIGAANSNFQYQQPVSPPPQYSQFENYQQQNSSIIEPASKAYPLNNSYQNQQQNNMPSTYSFSSNITNLQHSSDKSYEMSGKIDSSYSSNSNISNITYSKNNQQQQNQTTNSGNYSSNYYYQLPTYANAINGSAPPPIVSQVLPNSTIDYSQIQQKLITNTTTQSNMPIHGNISVNQNQQPIQTIGVIQANQNETYISGKNNNSMPPNTTITNSSSNLLYNPHWQQVPMSGINSESNNLGLQSVPQNVSATSLVQQYNSNTSSQYNQSANAQPYTQSNSQPFISNSSYNNNQHSDLAYYGSQNLNKPNVNQISHTVTTDIYGNNNATNMQPTTNVGRTDTKIDSSSIIYPEHYNVPKDYNLNNEINKIISHVKSSEVQNNLVSDSTNIKPVNNNQYTETYSQLSSNNFSLNPPQILYQSSETVNNKTKQNHGDQIQSQRTNLPSVNITPIQSLQPSTSKFPVENEKPIINIVPQINQKIKKSSNIDLLSGIDFSDSTIITTRPLQPLPATRKKTESEVSKSKEEEEENIKPVIDNETDLNQKLEELEIQESLNKNIEKKSFVTNNIAANSSHERKPSLDNLSICSDLSSLDTNNIDWDSVSIRSTDQKITNLEEASSFLSQNQKSPFDDPKVLNYFHKEVERYEKQIETLNIKMLNGSTPLINKWKELQDLLVKNETKRTTTIGKLFPEKNRSQDSIPYDHARVILERSTDNYINAAYVKDLGAGCPTFIIAQTPLSNTVNDFWSMIWTNKTRIIVCLHTPKEILDTFWPQELNKEMSFDDFSVTLVKENDLSDCIELYLKLTMNGADAILDLSLLQLKAWTKNSPSQVIGIAGNILTAFKQRCQEFKIVSPIAMNCLTGSDRSGIIAVAICAILAVQMKRPTLINIIYVWYRICSQRRSALRDQATLEYSMQIVLAHAHDVINKYGIMTSYQMKNSQNLTKIDKEEIKDPLSELDALWKMK